MSPRGQNLPQLRITGLGILKIVGYGIWTLNVLFNDIWIKNKSYLKYSCSRKHSWVFLTFSLYPQTNHAVAVSLLYAVGLCFLERTFSFFLYPASTAHGRWSKNELVGRMLQLLCFLLEIYVDKYTAPPLFKIDMSSCFILCIISLFL